MCGALEAKVWEACGVGSWPSCLLGCYWKQKGPPHGQPPCPQLQLWWQPAHASTTSHRGMRRQPGTAALHPGALSHWEGTVRAHLHRQPGAQVARHGSKVAGGALVILRVEGHHSRHAGGWIGCVVEEWMAARDHTFPG